MFQIGNIYQRVCWLRPCASRRRRVAQSHAWKQNWHHR